MNLELKLPPPVVAALCAGTMAAIAAVVPAATWPVPMQVALAGVLLALGVLVAAAGVFAFHRHRTTINPHAPDRTTALVTSGVYRLTRNPMYLGMLLVLTAWAIWLGNAAALAVLPVFVAYLGRFQIAPEERVLAARFGPTFDAYRARVRRWL